MNNIEVKEEGKVKSWFKKHKTGVAVGTTALAGIGLSIASYHLGLRNGRNDGYKNGVNFMLGENELLIQELRDKE